MSESSNTAALVAEQVEREAERIAESVVRRAPVFLEKVTGDLYETLLSEVQSYLRDNAAFNIKSELSMLRATIAAKDDALSAQAKDLEEATAEIKRVKLAALTHIDEMSAFQRQMIAMERQRDEALAALKASEAREGEALAALQPFAERVPAAAYKMPPDTIVCRAGMEIKHFARARAVLSTKEMGS